MITLFFLISASIILTVAAGVGFIVDYYDHKKNNHEHKEEISFITSLVCALAIPCYFAWMVMLFH